MHLSVTDLMISEFRSSYILKQNRQQKGSKNHRGQEHSHHAAIPHNRSLGQNLPIEGLDMSNEDRVRAAYGHWRILDHSIYKNVQGCSLFNLCTIQYMVYIQRFYLLPKF
jgi:hypothetical protein